jgi:hypothetical protein
MASIADTLRQVYLLIKLCDPTMKQHLKIEYNYDIDV